MRVLLHSEESLTLSAFDAPGLDVDVEPGAHAHYSAFQMFAVGIGLCTSSVLVAWAETAKLPTEGLSIRLGWTIAEHPRRIGSFDTEIAWPGLPEARVRAAERAAALCPLHRTLEHPPQLTTRVVKAHAPAAPHVHAAPHEHHHGS